MAIIDGDFRHNNVTLLSNKRISLQISNSTLRSEVGITFIQSSKWSLYSIRVIKCMHPKLQNVPGCFLRRHFFKNITEPLKVLQKSPEWVDDLNENGD